MSFKSHLNHKRLSAKFIYEQLDIFSQPMTTIKIGIIIRDFKRNQNY